MAIDPSASVPKAPRGARLALAIVALGGIALLAYGLARASGALQGADSTSRLLDAIACGKGDRAACESANAADRARCDRGEAQGCVLLGLAHQVGQRLPKDEAAAIPFFQRACDLRDPSGCWYLGSAYERGRGVVKDDTRAVTAYQRGCDIGGDVNVCDSLGVMYERGRGVPTDKVRALAIYDRGCSFGKPGAMGFVCDHAKKLRAELAGAPR